MSEDRPHIYLGRGLSFDAEQLAKRGIEGGGIERPLDAPKWSRWAQWKFKRAWRRRHKRQSPRRGEG